MTLADFKPGDRVRAICPTNQKWAERIGVGTVKRITAKRVIVIWDNIPTHRGYYTPNHLKFERGEQ